MNVQECSWRKGAKAGLAVKSNFNCSLFTKQLKHFLCITQIMCNNFLGAAHSTLVIIFKTLKERAENSTWKISRNNSFHSPTHTRLEIAGGNLMIERGEKSNKYANGWESNAENEWGG